MKLQKMPFRTEKRLTDTGYYLTTVNDSTGQEFRFLECENDILLYECRAYDANNFSMRIEARHDEAITAGDACFITSGNNCVITAKGSSIITSGDGCSITVGGSSTINARSWSNITACPLCSIRAGEHSSIVATSPKEVVVGDHSVV